MPRRTVRDARRRALGQNFLHDPAVVADVVGTLHPPPEALVVDLGAGTGALTRELARRGCRVVAVELDPQWAAVLRREAAAWGDVTVVHGDALTAALPAEPHLVVSNAPYHLGTSIVRRLLSAAHGLSGASVVLQREAALRLAGRPRTSLFAATWAPWFALSTTRPIPPAAFRPVPSVESLVLRIRPREAPLLSPAAFSGYARFLNRAFSGRGTTLAARARVQRSALREAGIASGATPSQVPPEVYARLYALVTGRAEGRPQAWSGARPGR